jgi:uncharacterized protein DUF5666
MRRLFLALPVAALVVAGWSINGTAQETKRARGSVTAVAADSITVKVGNDDMKFAVDDKTKVEAPGAGTRTRKAQAAGAAGAKLSDLVKVGDPVEVNYHDGATKHAASIRKVASAAPLGPEAKSANGTVSTVSDSSLTISGSSGGGASFTQTFTIDSKTKVIGKGAGTAAAASGGRIAASSLIGKGDKVSVSYHEMGSTLHAAEIRVTDKAAK